MSTVEISLYRDSWSVTGVYRYVTYSSNNI